MYGNPPRITVDTPPIVDSRTLFMSQVTSAQLSDALNSRRPIGFPSIERWEAFQADLAHALHREGVHDAQVRVGGSSRAYWRSPFTRPFPASGDELTLRVQEYSHELGLAPDETVQRVRHALALYTALGYDQPGGARPAVWGWDWKFLFGAGDPGDYDIMIASDTINDRMLARGAVVPGGVESMRIGHHGQWRQVHVIAEFSAFAELKDRWQEHLGRAVDIECFGRDAATLERFASRPDWWRIRDPEEPAA